jgi:hypothetical protein
MEQIPIHQIIQSFESKISEKEKKELDKWLSESAKTERHLKNFEKLTQSVEN